MDLPFDDEFRTDRFFSSEVGASARASDFTAVWSDGTVSIAGLRAMEWAKQELHLTAAEYFGFLVLLSYVVVYIVGRRRNYQIAKGFIDGVHGLFCSRFVHAGPALEIPPADQRQLLARDSCKTFLYYATGSRRCSSVLVTIDLASRHDLFMLVWNLFSPATDRVTVEVAFGDDDIEPMIFAVARKRDVKRLLQRVPHLQDYTGVTRAPSLRPSLGLVCVTESVVLLDPLLPPWASKALDETQDLLELLHVTDRNEQPILGREGTPRKALRASFRLLAGSGSGNARKMIELVLSYIELLNRFKMSPGARKKARERREAVAKRKSKMTHAQRQEHFRQLKDERLRREREEYEGLTPDQKRRRDLRDEKRAKKSSASRRLKMKLTKA
ncbi:unnamed protein product [Scytosiphon promiscuus]